MNNVFIEFIDIFVSVFRYLFPFMIFPVVFHLVYYLFKLCIISDNDTYSENDFKPFLGHTITDTIDNIINSDRTDKEEMIEWFSKNMIG